MNKEQRWTQQWWLISTLCALWGVPASAQDAQGEQDVLTVTVDEGTFVQIQLAIPPALNQGEGVDEMGVTEALSGTVTRDLRISGFFNLLDPNQVLANPKKEGMNPVYKDWFNSGAQGLVKIGFSVQGDLWSWPICVSIVLMEVSASNCPNPTMGPSSYR